MTEPSKLVYMVFHPSVGLLAGYSAEDGEKLAHQHAKAVKGIIVACPVVADYRSEAEAPQDEPPRCPTCGYADKDCEHAWHQPACPDPWHLT